jgi:hypothetical protein
MLIILIKETKAIIHRGVAEAGRNAGWKTVVFPLRLSVSAVNPSFYESSDGKRFLSVLCG